MWTTQTTDSDLEQPTLKTAELGQTFTDAQLAKQAQALVGGVAWPGKRPGFVVVLALDPKLHFDGHDMVLLDEAETADLRALVRLCAALDAKYKPAGWFGDGRHGAADRFIQEVNAERRHATPGRPELYVGPTSVLDMERPYEYFLPLLKALLVQDSRRLFLKTSRVLEYLGQIKLDEIPFLEFGEYPAVEAVSFAAIEGQSYAKWLDAGDGDSDWTLAESYVTRSAL